MSKFAVITTGGKQYIVREGDNLKVEKLELKEGDTLNLAPLLIASDDGLEFNMGKPEVAGKMVEAKVVAQGRARKVEIVKFKAKVRFKRKNGHRQPFTEINIVAIR